MSAADTAELRAEAQKLYAQFVKVRQPCGKAARDAETLLTATEGDYDPRLMDLAERGQRACRATMAEFAALPIPKAADRPLEDRYEAAVDDCEHSTDAIGVALFEVAKASGTGALQSEKSALLVGLRDAHTIAQACSVGLAQVVTISVKGDA
jgi:hypothetical protein